MIEKDKWNNWYSTGGMDFGSVAVYTCSNEDTCAESECFVVIQDTTDDQPKVPVEEFRQASDVVVDEKLAQLEMDNDDEAFVADT